MQRLEQALQEMPEEERHRALEYYENYFDEAGADEEQNVLRDLGAPEKVAADILREFREDAPFDPEQFAKPKRSFRTYFDGLDNGQKLLFIGLAALAIVCILPVCIGVVGGVGGILVGLVCAAAAVFLVVPILGIASWCCAVVCFIAVFNIIGDAAVGVLLIGLICIFFALGILLFKLTVYLYQNVLLGFVRWIVDSLNRLIHPKH